MICFCLFCMQQTSYEMRISDWSSDVCSSDLVLPRRDIGQRRAALRRVGGAGARHEAEMLAEIADNQRRLEPGGKGIELCDRARQRPVRPPDLSVGEIRERPIAARSVGQSVCPGQRRGLVLEAANSGQRGSDGGGAKEGEEGV